MSVWWVWSPRVIGVPQAHVRVSRCLIWARANDHECHETPVYSSKVCDTRGGSEGEMNRTTLCPNESELSGSHSPFRGHYHCSRTPITFLSLQSCSHHGQGRRETEREVEWERQKQPVFVMWKRHRLWALLRLHQYCYCSDWVSVSDLNIPLTLMLSLPFHLYKMCKGGGQIPRMYAETRISERWEWTT